MGLNCYKHSRNYILDSPVSACISSVVSRGQAKCNVHEEKLHTSKTADKIPHITLNKLNILEGEDVLIKDGKMYVNCKELSKVSSNGNICISNPLKDKYIIVQSQKIYVEYSKLLEYRSESLSGSIVWSSFYNSPKEQVNSSSPLTFQSIETLARSSDICKTNGQILTSDKRNILESHKSVSATLKNCSVVNKPIKRLNNNDHNTFDQISSSKKHFAGNLNFSKSISPALLYNPSMRDLNTADDSIYAKNLEVSNGIGTHILPRCKEQTATNKCSVTLRRMEDNVQFMGSLSLKAIWVTALKPTVKRNIKSKPKYQKVSNNGQKYKILKPEQGNLKKNKLQNCKVVLKRVATVEDMKKTCNDNQWRK